MSTIYRDISKNGKNYIYFSNKKITIYIPYEKYDYDSMFKNDKDRAIEEFWKKYNKLNEN